MTPSLSTLRSLAEAATPGPWKYKVQNRDHLKNLGIEMLEEVVREYSPDKPLVTVRATAWKPERWADARNNALFIAACSPPVILALIAEVEELRAKTK